MKRHLGLRVGKLAPQSFAHEGHDYTLEIQGGRVALVCAPGLKAEEIEDLQDALPCAALVVNYPAEIEVLEVIERRTRSERLLEVLDVEEPVADEPPSGIGISTDLDRYTYSVTWSEADRLYWGLCAEIDGLVSKAPTRIEALEGIVREVTKVVSDDPTGAIPAFAGPQHTVKFFITWITEAEE